MKRIRPTCRGDTRIISHQAVSTLISSHCIPNHQWVTFPFTLPHTPAQPTHRPPSPPPLRLIRSIMSWVCPRHDLPPRVPHCHSISSSSQFNIHVNIFIWAALVCGLIRRIASARAFCDGNIIDARPGESHTIPDVFLMADADDETKQRLRKMQVQQKQNREMIWISNINDKCFVYIRSLAT